VPIADPGSYYPGSEVETALYDLGRVEEIANGLTLNKIELCITSDGATITGSLSAAVGNTLYFKFSDGITEVDTTAPMTATLTEGTDTIPVLNYLYVLQADPTTLVSSTVGFPAAEFCAIGRIVCQSAASAAGDGPLKQHTWSDEIINEYHKGHATHINSWIREQWATWVSGVAPTFSGDGTATIGLAITSGFVRQLHKLPYPVFADPADIYCVNDPDTKYRKITNIADLLKDSTGAALKNKTYAIVIWGCISDNGDSKLFCNLPSGSYLKVSQAREDTNKYTNYSIPADFKGAGFLIYRLIIDNNNNTTWDLDTGGYGDDLRGTFPNTVAGSAAVASLEFPDGAAGFTLQNAADPTKQVQTDLGGITTGNTRVITFPDHNIDLGYLNQDVTTGASPLFAGLGLGAGNLTLTGYVGRDADNLLSWVVDDNLKIIIAGVEHNIVSISDGAADNDKLATQGYVDDAGGGGANAVTASAIITDHTLVRGHGGARIVQDTGITVDDTDNVSGVGTLGCGEITVADGSGINLQEDITFTGATGENLIKIPDNLANSLTFEEDTNKYLTFVSTNGSEKIELGKKLDVGDNEIEDVKSLVFNDGGSTVDIVRDEDDMVSDDPNALATQQSIKAYVDAGGGNGALEVIDTTTVAGAAVTSVTFTGFSTADYHSFDLECVLENALGSLVNISVFLNTDTTVTNYYRQYWSTVNNGKDNAAYCAELWANEFTSFVAQNIRQGVDGMAKWTVTENKRHAGNILYVNYAIEYKLTPANITDITVFAHTANAIDIGSKVTLYGRKK